jgi:hypothetical protein
MAPRKSKVQYYMSNKINREDILESFNADANRKDIIPASKDKKALKQEKNES